MLRWAHQSGLEWDGRAAAEAARKGNLRLLQWMKTQGCPWTATTCAAAASGGHLKVKHRILFNQERLMGDLSCLSSVSFPIQQLSLGLFPAQIECTYKRGAGCLWFLTFTRISSLWHCLSELWACCGLLTGPAVCQGCRLPLGCTSNCCSCCRWASCHPQIPERFRLPLELMVHSSCCCCRAHRGAGVAPAAGMSSR